VRPAWLEIDLGILKANFDLILRDKPSAVDLCSVVKDEAYGHGALRVARTAAQAGLTTFAVSTLEEALELRQDQLPGSVLLLGERPSEEMEWCVRHNIQFCVSRPECLPELERLAAHLRQTARVHVKIDTGMSRYGVRWTDAPALIESVTRSEWISLAGLMSHFAMSDESDKTFAHQQLARFHVVLDQLRNQGIPAGARHMCNSGGYLDLPEAHFDMVRIGLLPLGVYPSKACRRIPGLRPVLEVKSRLASIQNIQAGDNVGYGLRFQAPSPRRIGVLPIGYGDGYPRLRNQGHVLIHGKRAPITGANAMDAMMVDLTDIPEARFWDEAVLLGQQGDEQISVHDLAGWGNTVSYDILSGWRSRLPKLYVNRAA
jgi:alanine racemase